jgi:hypothetical protein
MFFGVPFFHFLPKIDPWAAHGSIFGDFWAPRSNIKKRRFFESPKNGPKRPNNRPWDAQGAILDQKASGTPTDAGRF